MHPHEWKIDGKPATAGQVRLVVFQRDRSCLASQVDPTHLCRNRWNRIHAADDWAELTLEHVPSVHYPADVRRDDPEHCVTLCHAANVGVPSKDLRRHCRSSLLKITSVCPSVRPFR